MPLLVSRREFLAGMGVGAATVVVSRSCYALAESASPFRVSIINEPCLRGCVARIRDEMDGIAYDVEQEHR
jgi:hypothetical protein